MIPTPLDEASLPPFLRECPTEPEDQGLQLQLLTMEVATQRLALANMAQELRALADSLPTSSPLVVPLRRMAAVVDPPVGVLIDG